MKEKRWQYIMEQAETDGDPLYWAQRKVKGLVEMAIWPRPDRRYEIEIVGVKEGFKI
jgi:hypothetical protein